MIAPPPRASMSGSAAREHARDVLVGADIALGDKRAGYRLRELAHAFLDSLALIREGELGATVGEPLGDRPRDRAAVRHSENQPPLGLVGHPARLDG